MSSQLGSGIKTYRKRKNMTQSELAKKLSKSLRTIQKYESGEITPPLEVLDKLADILEVSLYELIVRIDLPFWEMPELSDITKKYAWQVLGMDKVLFLERCENPFAKSIYEERLGEKYVNESIEIAKKDILSKSQNSDQTFDENQEDENQREAEEISVDDLFMGVSYVRLILSEVDKLNLEGKRMAIESIKLLTKIPEYQDSKEGD